VKCLQLYYTVLRFYVPVPVMPKLVPVIVNLVLPPVAPCEGATDVTVGGAYVYVTRPAPVVGVVWLLTVTMTDKFTPWP